MIGGKQAYLYIYRLKDIGVIVYFLHEADGKVIFVGRKERRGVFGGWKRVKTFEKGNSKRKKMNWAE